MGVFLASNSYKNFQNDSTGVRVVILYVMCSFSVERVPLVGCKLLTSGLHIICMLKFRHFFFGIGIVIIRSVIVFGCLQ